ncbi:MAG: hypothetical protein ACKORC_05565 [Acidimicrobiia bacterium]
MRRVALVAAALACAGCATTVTDSARGGDAPPTTVPVTAPAVDDATPTAEIFAEMAATAARLTEAMSDGDRTAARAHLAVLAELGDALAPRVARASEQLAADLARVLDLARSAVERNRPADADKAVRFLPLVAAAAAALGVD